MFSKVLLFFTIALLIVVPTHTQTPSDCTAVEGAPVRIGAIFPQNSLLSVNIDEHYNGVQAMSAALNACGGVDGRPIELVYEAATDRESAQAAAQTLVDDGITLIVGSGTPAVSEALTTFAAANEVIFWEVTQSLSASNVWSYSPRPTRHQLGEQTAAFVQQSLVDVVGEAPAVALIHADAPHGIEAAQGLRSGLSTQPIIDVNYGDSLSWRSSYAEDVRDQAADVLIFSGYDDDADRLWFSAREANANVKAFINVGSEGYRRNLCQRIGNNEALLSVSATGTLSRAYRGEITNGTFQQYMTQYMRLFSEEPNERTTLSAAGFYLLARYVLPQVETFTAESIRAAIIEADVATGSGFMGEGLRFEGSINTRAQAIVQQRQNGAFCSVWPEAGATCLQEPQPMPTWRERAIMAERMLCASPA
jgi:ABC-type branched-subunit amino acid transport system substrate-binding protein